MKKRIIRFYIMTFIIIFMFPGIICNLFASRINTPNYEQRALAEKPSLNYKTLKRYPELFERYYSDNLPFRNQMITAYSWIEFYVFKQSPVDKVIVGENGWLFYNPNGMDGDSMADYYCEDLYTEQELEGIANNLTKINKGLESQGREFIVYIAPNKETVYGSMFLPEDYPRNDGVTKADQVVEYLKQEKNIKVVYPKKAFDKEMSENSQYIYYAELGTHWNQLGAYIGTKELLKELNIIVPEVEELEIKSAEGTDRGLAEMMGLGEFLKNDTEYELLGYTTNRIKTVDDTFDKTKYVSTSSDCRKVLLIGDSFGRWMAPYLASQFSSTYQFHRQYYDVNILEEQDSDVVILEVVERYLDELSKFAL